MFCGKPSGCFSSAQEKTIERFQRNRFTIEATGMRVKSWLTSPGYLCASSSGGNHGGREVWPGNFFFWEHFLRGLQDGGNRGFEMLDVVKVQGVAKSGY